MKSTLDMDLLKEMQEMELMGIIPQLPKGEPKIPDVITTSDPYWKKDDTKKTDDQPKYFPSGDLKLPTVIYDAPKEGKSTYSQM